MCVLRLYSLPSKDAGRGQRASQRGSTGWTGLRTSTRWLNDAICATIHIRPNVFLTATHPQPARLSLSLSTRNAWSRRSRWCCTSWFSTSRCPCSGPCLISRYDASMLGALRLFVVVVNCDASKRRQAALAACESRFVAEASFKLAKINTLNFWRVAVAQQPRRCLVLSLCQHAVVKPKHQF